MSEIRYVCLSDVHFAAENSLLTHLEPGAGEIDVARPSPVLVGLVQCLDHLIGGWSGQRPTLVLHGDIFELALAEANLLTRLFIVGVAPILIYDRSRTRRGPPRYILHPPQVSEVA